ncbi:MAG: SEC-C domain-containing protein [Anaerolineae bacterium]|nr:SEC-C domain-containing protein [Anaerolineae bacterium]
MIAGNVGRNDLCPCGSGKKYKHCHGQLKPHGFQAARSQAAGSGAGADVLYVHPAKQDVDFGHQKTSIQASEDSQLGRPYGLIPMGVPALVNVLQAAGIRVRGLNYPLERELNRSFDLRRWLRTQRQARVILVDMHWYEHSYGAISVANVCKEVLPDALVVLGGLTASGFAYEILEQFPSVDFVIRGDAEMPLLTLVQRCLAVPVGQAVEVSDIPNVAGRRGADVVLNPIGYCAVTEDLDALDYVDLGFLDHATEYYVHEYLVTDLPKARAALQTNPFLGRWVATARGCKYECSYCGGCKSAHQVLAMRDGIVPRSPEAVVAELERLSDAGVVQASLSYDIADWRTFFALMRQRGIKIGLYNECFQLPTPTFVKRFAQVADSEHSCLAFSPLSGDERVRRLNGKIFTNGELINVLDSLNLYDIFALVYFSLNLPGETMDTLKESIALAERLCELYPLAQTPGPRLRIMNSCHTLDPLSPMAVHPEKFGISVTMQTFNDWYTYCRETQTGSPAARTELFRGFVLSDEAARSLEAMANAWDAAQRGHEDCWWPIPPGW